MTVKAAALKPVRSDPYAVSLIRQRIGDNEAKIAAVTNVHPAGFWGFGVAIAGALIFHARGIIDDPDTFDGHANLEIMYDIPRGEANEPPVMDEEYEEAMRHLAALGSVFSVLEDPSPEQSGWTGAGLSAS